MSGTLPVCSACFYNIPSIPALFLRTLRIVLYISLSPDLCPLSSHELTSYHTFTIRLSVSRPRLLIFLVFCSINVYLKLSLLGVNMDSVTVWDTG